ncbi:MAG: hypothetical protein MJZ86_10885 [Bacteroidales bacterium]|nr:hypothetical protein [Bacteroidales bacterium]
MQTQPRYEVKGCGHFGAKYYDGEVLTMWLSIAPRWRTSILAPERKDK